MKRWILACLMLGLILHLGKASSLSEPVAYPNPFSPSQAVDGALKFADLLESDHIHIYTPDGVLVRSLGPASGGTLRWDGKDSEGSLVYPGLYIYVIEGTDGPTKIGRILVQK